MLCPFFSFSQSYTIEYDVTLNVLKRSGQLIINNNDSSFYFETLKGNTNDKEKQKIEEDGSLNKTFYLGKGKDRKRCQIYTAKKDTLYNIDYLEEEKIINYELFPKMDWTIGTDTKKIETYTCNKAITIFRGRKYIAWFTTEVPIQLGPWKFNGLPGAILQIYDESKAFVWAVTKIKQIKNSKKLKIEDNLKKMSLQKFVEENEKIKKARSDRMMLKFTDRGSKIKKTKFNRGREITFEWEKEIKED